MFNVHSMFSGLVEAWKGFAILKMPNSDCMRPNSAERIASINVAKQMANTFRGLHGVYEFSLVNGEYFVINDRYLDFALNPSMASKIIIW